MSTVLHGLCEPSASASSVRAAFCLCLAVSLWLTARSRANFFALRTAYIDGLGRLALVRRVGSFYTNTFAEVAQVSWPLNLLPGVGGWPLLSVRQYTNIVGRWHLLEIVLVAAAFAPPGGLAALALGMALSLYTLLFGQRLAQMYGMVSGGKDVVAAWSLALLLACEVDSLPNTGPFVLRVLLGCAYGIPGVTKLLLPLLEGRGLFAWLDGHTLQCILLERYVVCVHVYLCMPCCALRNEFIVSIALIALHDANGVLSPPYFVLSLCGRLVGWGWLG